MQSNFMMMYHVELFTNSSVEFHAWVEESFKALVDTRILGNLLRLVANADDTSNPGIVANSSLVLMKS